MNGIYYPQCMAVGGGSRSASDEDWIAIRWSRTRNAHKWHLACMSYSPHPAHPSTCTPRSSASTQPHVPTSIACILLKWAPPCASSNAWPSMNTVVSCFHGMMPSTTFCTATTASWCLLHTNSLMRFPCMSYHLNVHIVPARGDKGLLVQKLDETGKDCM